MYKALSCVRAGSVLTGILAAAFIFLASSSQIAQASHFRYGDIAWKVVGANTIEFKIKQAWRNFGSFVVGDTFSQTSLDFGDSSSTAINITVTTVDGPNNWVFGEFTVQHTYASTGDYVAFFQNCCRIGALTLNFHVNNPDGWERLQTIVNVGTVPGGNDSPVTTMPVIVNCEENSMCSFPVTAADPDGDPVNWRLSTAVEAAGAGNSFVQPSGAAVNSSTGEFTWSTPSRVAGKTHTLYSTQVMVEEFDAGGALITQVPVDFLIELVEDLGNAPTFDSLVCGTTETVATGATINFTVSASDVDGGDLVVLNATGIPTGATTTNDPLGTAGNPINTDFSWTPGAGDAGITVVVFTATDLNRLQALCPVTIEVTDIVEGEIDIKPGSDPNSINRKNRGVIPVAILGSTSFDVTTVDVTTLAFAPGGAMPAHTAGGHVEDVNGDGFDDLVSHYPTQDVALPDGATEACVTALLLDGTPFEGCDAVRIVK